MVDPDDVVNPKASKIEFESHEQKWFTSTIVAEFNHNHYKNQGRNGVNSDLSL